MSIARKNESTLVQKLLTINLYLPSRRCHGFCKAWALTLPPQSCAVKQTGRVLVLVPAGEHSACLQHRPAPRDGLPLLLNRPGQESRGRGHHHFSFGPCSAETLARGGNMVFGKPLLLRKSYERPSRLTHSSGLMMGKNTAPAADSTAIIKLQRT